MAAPTLCLLQWKLPRCNPARSPIQLPPPNKFPTRPLRVCRPLDGGLPRLSVNCCVPSKDSASIPAKRKRDDDPAGVLVGKVFGALEALKKTAVAAVLLGVLLACGVSSALAASGGRIGGNSFSSSRKSSSSSTSSPSSVSSSSRPPSSSSSYTTSWSRSSEDKSWSASSNSPSCSISFRIRWPSSDDSYGERSPSSEDKPSRLDLILILILSFAILLL